MKTYAEGYGEGYRLATKQGNTWIAIFSIGAFLLGVFVGMVLVRQVI